MKKVMITNAYADANKGDAGIILGLKTLLTEWDECIEVNLLSSFNENDPSFKTEHRFVENNVKNTYPSLSPIPNNRNILVKTYEAILYFIRSLLLLILTKYKFYNLAQFTLSKNERVSYKEMLNSDVIISKGGGFLYTNGGLKGFVFLFRVSFPLLLGAYMKKETIIFGQSIGPIKGKLGNSLMKYLIDLCSKVYVREDLSYEYALGCASKEKVKKIPDTAFYLNNIYDKIDRETMKILKGKVVGVTARPWGFEGRKDVDYLFNNYLEAMADSIDYLIEEYGYEVVFIPQVIGPTNRENDILAGKEIKSKVKNKDNFKVLTNDFSPHELIFIYSKLEFIIGTRMHSNIFSAVVGTPTIGISYQGPKTVGIMKELDLENYVIKITEINTETLKDKIDMIILEKQTIKENLKKKLTKIKDSLYNLKADVLGMK